MYLDENGMWFIFDDHLTHIKHNLSTINTIHVFSKSNKLSYGLNIKPKIKWLTPYNNINIYNTEYNFVLNQLFHYNNPITYIHFNNYNIQDISMILENSIKYIIQNTIIYIDSNNLISDMNIVLKYFDSKDVLYKVNKSFNKITIIKNINCNPRVLKQYFVSKKCIKTYNIRHEGWLWHYYHFINDCINIEFNNFHNNEQKYIIRLNQPDQSIGTFHDMYNNITNKKNKEVSLNKYRNLYCKTKIIDSNMPGHRPYPKNYFEKLSMYCIDNFYINNYPIYNVILIERRTQKLAYNDQSIKDIFNIYNKGQIYEKIFYKNFFTNKAKNAFKLTGSERRTIVNHNKIKKFLENKYNNTFKNIILEECTFNEQVTLFHNAKIIIGQHGAGLINMIFAKQKSQLIEIGPRRMNGFRNIAINKKLKYHFVENKESDILKFLSKLS